MSAAAVQPLPVTGTLALSALAYARRGWPVHPLKPGTKLPATEHGSKDATTDESTVIEWWRRWPDANIGIATGHRFWVLDVDTKHADAAAWLESVELPETVTQITGTRGRHYLYALPGFDVHNSQSKVGPHIDVRGVGGYIVAAPSIHPETRRQYAWDTETDIPTEEPAAAPGWLLEKLRPTNTGNQPFAVPPAIKHGVQHETLFKLACSMRAKGLEEPEIAAAVILVSKRCEVVPPEKNVVKIVADACKRYAPGPSSEFNRQVARTVEWATNKDEEQPDNEEYVDWKRRLHRKEPTLKQSVEGKPGKPLLNHLNVMVALQYAPEWKDVFVFNELKQKAQAVKPPPIGGKVPRDWTDADDTETVVWFQRNGIQIVSREMVGSCVQAWAKRHSINPLRQWLESLQWDGEPRVDGWLSTYFGVSPSSYAVSVGRYWLISGVARVLKPGPVQADHMLVLEGDQGIGKSTGLRALAGDEYFTDSMPDISSKDAQIHALNYWVIEMSELSALGKAEVEAVKSFIGKQMETFRRPYGHHEETVRRYCIFAGTTNRSDYLKDETGNRRFWPVKCTHADVARIAADREQLWAEAVALYRDGAKWWPENSKLLEAIEAEQAERMEGDPWQVEIERFVEAKDRVTAESVLIELGVEIPDMTQLHRRRVGKCLRECGFHPKYTRDMGRCFERRK